MSEFSFMPGVRPDEVRTVAVIGIGSVGASWAALHLAAGHAVVACDPAAGAEARARSFIAEAWPALRRLSLTQAAAPPQDHLRFVGSAGEAAAAADYVQENAFEKLEVKAGVLAEIDAALPPGRIIGSSTGGIQPSRLQQGLRHPERVLVVHPFNPAHLIPLVEIVGGAATAPAAVDWAMDFMRRLGKHPIRLKREAVGHLANRLQFALLREAVHCLVEDLASPDDIDAALRHGLGPRWALMGSLMILNLAGGPGGMAGILAHAGEAMESWWAALGQPSLTPEVRARLVEAAAELTHGRPVRDWELWRDERLVGLLEVVAQAPRYEAVATGAPVGDRGVQ